MNLETSPYRKPKAIEDSALIATHRRAFACPVCHEPLRRSAFIRPRPRCIRCKRTLKLHRTPKTTLLSLSTFVVLAISLGSFEQSIDNATPWSLIHAVAFFAITTLWFHLFGEPRLASWFGYASAARIATERQLYAAETDPD